MESFGKILKTVREEKQIDIYIPFGEYIIFEEGLDTGLSPKNYTT